MKSASVLLALLGLASAAPTASTSYSGTQVLATFDDLTAVPGVSELSPVGVYKGLNWTSLDVLQLDLNGDEVAGVNAESSPNVAANGVTDDLVHGGIRITTATVSAFDFQSAYIACVVNSVETVAGVPETCTVAFTAYKAGSTIAYQTINEEFNPTNAVTSNMQKVVFPSTWLAMSRVDIAVVQSTSSATLTGFLLDSVSYKTYTYKS